MTEDKVYCLLCGDESDDWHEAVNHIHIRHPDYYSEPERWPDGRVVIVDQAIDPEDFGN